MTIMRAPAGSPSNLPQVLTKDVRWVELRPLNFDHHALLMNAFPIDLWSGKELTRPSAFAWPFTRLAFCGIFPTDSHRDWHIIATFGLLLNRKDANQQWEPVQILR